MKYLVTGGAGFLGAAFVRRLVSAGHWVRVLDDQSRGSVSQLADVASDIEMVEADVRDAHAVQRAMAGVDRVCHLACVNGTEFFYSKPDIVLEVGVKGMVNVLDACLAQGVKDLVLVSSSEVYQSPPTIPTGEDVPLMIPDPMNPRYSYAGAKQISELLAINYGRQHFDRVIIVRPHNVYGPAMGWEHVIPQCVLRMRALCREPMDPVPFPIQGTGLETRAFVFIDDYVDGMMIAIERGTHLGIYHIGTTEELTIKSVAERIGAYFHRRVQVIPGPARQGSTPRRCPDIRRLATLGYEPRVAFNEGLALTAQWYDAHASEQPIAQERLTV